MLLPHAEWKRSVIQAVAHGYELVFTQESPPSYPKGGWNHEQRQFILVNHHQKSIDVFKAIEANRAKHIREAQIARIFAGNPTPDDLVSLGLTEERLGIDVFYDLVARLDSGTLTNQHLKSLIIKA